MTKLFFKLTKRIYPEWGRSWEAWVKYYIATDYRQVVEYLQKEFNLSFDASGIAKKYVQYDEDCEEFTLREIKFEEIPHVCS